MIEEVACIILIAAVAFYAGFAYGYCYAWDKVGDRIRALLRKYDEGDTHA